MLSRFITDSHLIANWEGRQGKKERKYCIFHIRWVFFCAFSYKVKRNCRKKCVPSISIPNKISPIYLKAGALAAPIFLLFVFDFSRFWGKYEIFLLKYIQNFIFGAIFLIECKLVKICLTWWQYQKWARS